MSKQIDYTTVEISGMTTEADQRVVNHLADGWQLQGFPFHVPGLGIYQAMVKYEEPIPHSELRPIVFTHYESGSDTMEVYLTEGRDPHVFTREDADSKWEEQR